MINLSGDVKKCAKKLLIFSDDSDEGSDSSENENEGVMTSEEEMESENEGDAASKAIFRKCQESLDDEQKGFFYCIYFDEGYYWGRLLKVFANDSDAPADTVEIDFLRYSCGYWDFPPKKDVKIIDSKYVFYGPCKPSHTSV